MIRSYNPYDDKKSIHYVPNHVGDLGYSEEEAAQLSEKDDEEVDRRIANFKRALKEKNELKAKVKEERLQRKMENHWYCSLPEYEVRILIDNTLHLVEGALNEVIMSEKLQAKINHVSMLRNLIKARMNYKVLPADNNKLKRFPQMEASGKRIFGSKYAFLALWSHVYSTGRKSKVSLISK